MTPRPNAARIGLFFIGGLGLLLGAVVLVFGGRLLSRPELAVMHFRDSVHGLQIGAPVVLRGVRLGAVRSIGIVSEGQDFRVPVVVEIDRGLIREASGADPASDPELQVAALVRRGLRARLGTQSLLTGQLYVALEMRPDEAPKDVATRGGLPEIPTSQPLLQALQAQLEKLDIVGLTRDVQATLADARALIAGPEVRRTLDQLAQASASLARLSGALERRVPALAGSAQTALAQAGAAAGRVASAADRVGDAAGSAQALLAPDSPTQVRVQRAADELAQSAAALRALSAGDSATVQQLQQSLDELGRAARAVRQLAELLDRQPEALIRGRSAAP